MSCRSSRSTCACSIKRRTRPYRCSSGSNSSASRPTNLDEFFEIRVSGLKHRLEASAAPLGPDNLGSAEVLRQITEQARMLVNEQYRVLNDEIIPALRDQESLRPP